MADHRFDHGANKKTRTEPDADGWADHATITTVRAIQMPETFSVRLPSGSTLTGKPRDYLVDNGTSQWVVDKGIFEKTYERVA